MLVLLGHDNYYSSLFVRIIKQWKLAYNRVSFLVTGASNLQVGVGIQGRVVQSWVKITQG